MRQKILTAGDLRATCIGSDLKIPTGTVFVQNFPEGASAPKDPIKIVLGPETKPMIPSWEIIDTRPKQ
jgi:hypothetical protein